MVRPDFFVVGAPKCGTTALTDYLRQHPQVSRILKEVHFFGSDLSVVRGAFSEPEYLARFENCTPPRRTGDASVFYLHSQRAAQEIKAFAPAARIVVMLRNPTDMLHSLHSQFVFVDSEDITDFASAIAADDERLGGRRLPVARVIAQSGYRAIARYTPQVRRYLDTFGRDAVHTIIYDDFAADTMYAFRQTCTFLGLDDTFEPSVRVVNANKQARSTTLRRIVEHPSPMMRRVVRTLPSQPLRRGLSAMVKRANTRYEPRAPMDPELRAQLNREFAPEVEQLSELLGRDLTAWSRAR